MKGPNKHRVDRRGAGRDGKHRRDVRGRALPGRGGVDERVRPGQRVPGSDGPGPVPPRAPAEAAGAVRVRARVADRPIEAQSGAKLTRVSANAPAAEARTGPRPAC